MAKKRMSEAEKKKKRIYNAKVSKGSIKPKKMKVKRKKETKKRKKY